MKIKVKVHPNSKIRRVEKINNDEFEIYVKSPAIENKANIETIDAMSEFLGIQRSKIQIIHGLRFRNKILEVGK